MSADDDKALSWDEVSDPTYVAVPPEKVERVEPVETPLLEPAKPTTGSFLLVSYGILGGVVLLYTVGWILGIRQVVFPTTNSLDAIASFVSQILAVAAPVIWFGGSFVLTRGTKPIVRLLLLLLGLVATLPLPFILLGAS